MPITFAPGKPENKTFELLPKGKHKFTVVEVKSDTSTAGNDIVKATLKHESGLRVYDTMTLTVNAIWKFRQFVAACGQNPESGSFDDEDCIGKEIEAMIGVEPAKGDYDARNKVQSYVCDDGGL